MAAKATAKPFSGTFSPKGLVSTCLSANIPVRRRANRARLARLIDWLVPVRPGSWAFVSKKHVPIAGNLRASLDHVARHSGGDIVVYSEGGVNGDLADALESAGARLLSAFNLLSLYYLLSSETVVVSHSARDAYISRRKRGRAVVNVWHGVALKRIEALMPARDSDEHERRLALIKRNGEVYDAVLASNEVDRLVNSCAFNVPFEKVHAVGLPRFDYFRTEHRWPADLANQEARLADAMEGRQLLLYAPTFREHGMRLRDLLPDHELAIIQKFCARERFVFAVRPHPYQQAEFDRDFAAKGILDLSPARYPETAVVLNKTSLLVADYSSIWVDFLFTDRPVIGFCPDMKAYISKDRNFIYDYEKLFPGPIANTWTEALELACACQGRDHAERRQHARKMLLPEPASRTACERFMSEVVSSLPNRRSQTKPRRGHQ